MSAPTAPAEPELCVRKRPDPALTLRSSDLELASRTAALKDELVRRDCEGER